MEIEYDVQEKEKLEMGGRPCYNTCEVHCGAWSA
jgi:hypothetical protein